MSKTEKRVLDRFDRRSGVVIVCNSDEGKTQQQFKDECDVNNIVEKYTKTGLWSNSVRPGTRVPQWGDFTEAPDFQECMDRIVQAEKDFEGLPSKIRKRFNNNPAELLEFIANKDNKEECISLGLIEKPQAAASPAAEPAGITPPAKA